MQRKHMPIWFLGFLSAYSLFTFDVYQPALPMITKAFSSTHAVGQLTLNIYLFFFGVSQLLWGPLIDNYGRRKLLPVSLMVAIIAALVCVVAKSMTVLIVGRALQGVAICCSGMIAQAASRDYDDDKERAKVLSFISMVVAASPVFAPSVGALMLQYFDWQANFVLMAVLGCILLSLCFYLLRESPHFHVSKVSFSGWTVIKNYQEILRHRYLLLGSCIVALAFSAVMISIVNASYLLIDGLHYTPKQFALIFALNGFNIVLSNAIGIRLREYFSMHWNIIAGLVVMAVGGILVGIIYYCFGFNVWMLSPVLLVNIGVGIVLPPTISLVLASYDTLTASAVAMMNTIRVGIAAIISGVVSVLLAGHIMALSYSILACAISGLVLAYFFISAGVLPSK